MTAFFIISLIPLIGAFFILYKKKRISKYNKITNNLEFHYNNIINELNRIESLDMINNINEKLEICESIYINVPKKFRNNLLVEYRDKSELFTKYIKLFLILENKLDSLSESDIINYENELIMIRNLFFKKGFFDYINKSFSELSSKLSLRKSQLKFERLLKNSDNKVN